MMQIPKPIFMDENENEGVMVHNPNLKQKTDGMVRCYRIDKYQEYWMSIISIFENKNQVP